MKTILLALVAVAVCNAVGSASEIKFFTHSSEGQTYLDAAGELRGKKHAGKRAFNVEVVRALLAVMHHPAQIETFPFKRGLSMVQKGDNIAFFNVSRTPGREHTVKWVGPLQKETDYFYEMKDEPTGITQLEDAKKVAGICVLNGSIHETILRQNNFTNIFTNPSYIGCFKMLKLGRVSLTPSAETLVGKRMEQAGLTPDQVRQTPVVLLESEGYIAFSKNIADEVIRKWQHALDQLIESGRYQQLFNEYYASEDK